MTDLEIKMSTAVMHYEKELNSLRTSRANPSILDNIYVEAYGSKTPLNQLTLQKKKNHKINTLKCLIGLLLYHKR